MRYILARFARAFPAKWLTFISYLHEVVMKYLTPIKVAPYKASRNALLQNRMQEIERGFTPQPVFISALLYPRILEWVHL